MWMCVYMFIHVCGVVHVCEFGERVEGRGQRCLSSSISLYIFEVGSLLPPGAVRLASDCLGTPPVSPSPLRVLGPHYHIQFFIRGCWESDLGANAWMESKLLRTIFPATQNYFLVGYLESHVAYGLWVTRSEQRSWRVLPILGWQSRVAKCQSVYLACSPAWSPGTCVKSHIHKYMCK